MDATGESVFHFEYTRTPRQVNRDGKSTSHLEVRSTRLTQKHMFLIRGDHTNLNVSHQELSVQLKPGFLGSSPGDALTSRLPTFGNLDRRHQVVRFANVSVSEFANGCGLVGDSGAYLLRFLFRNGQRLASWLLGGIHIFLRFNLSQT